MALSKRERFELLLGHPKKLMNNTPTPTPRTDETEKIADKLGSPAASYGFTLARLKETERELNAAREEINTLKNMCISNANEANELRQQRDRLAEELKEANQELEFMHEAQAGESV